MARPKKSDLLTKVAKEQNLDPEQLDRLPVTELEKMDLVVPDEDGSDILAEAPKKRLLGYHPITGAEVWM
jgi:hypothetical protein